MRKGTWTEPDELGEWVRVSVFSVYVCVWAHPLRSENPTDWHDLLVVWPWLLAVAQTISRPHWHHIHFSSACLPPILPFPGRNPIRSLTDLCFSITIHLFFSPPFILIALRFRFTRKASRSTWPHDSQFSQIVLAAGCERAVIGYIIILGRARYITNHQSQD